MANNNKLLFNGKVYNCQPGETVLAALLRQKVDVPYACQKMTCMTCMMRSLSGAPPAESQQNLKETLQLQNNFLACGCIPHKDMEIALTHETLIRLITAEVVEVNQLSSIILEVVLQCETPIDYHGGQSVLLLNYEHIGKNFPIASPGSARTSGRLEVHVERIVGGSFSEWIHTKLKVGDQLTVSGISGELFYTPGQPQTPLLLAAWNGGLSALIGLIQDAFEQEHNGPVWLFHGVSDPEHLYYRDELNEIGDYFPNFKYIPCIDRNSVPEGCQQGALNQILQEMLPNLNGWKVFLCGDREQVHVIQRYAYLAGAGMQDIYHEVTSI